MARTKKPITPKEPMESNITITTILFPEHISFNTGSSMDRWSKKTARLTSAKSKTHTPRKNILDDEYDFSYDISDILQDQNAPDNLELENDEQNESISLSFDGYEVSSDIEELLLKSQRTNAKSNEKSRVKKKTCDKITEENADDKVKKKRNKLKKTIRFSFSKPASPVTEQVIRVDVTSNISPEELSEIENTMMNNNFLKHSCSKGHGKVSYHEIVKMASPIGNNTKKDIDLSEGMEEDFIIKCRQLALTPKAR